MLDKLLVGLTIAAAAAMLAAWGYLLYVVLGCNLRLPASERPWWDMTDQDGQL